MSLPTRFTIGQPVEANMTCKYDEWRGVPLWVAGINAKLLTGENVYVVSESWPPQNPGHLSDPWKEDELCARGAGQFKKAFQSTQVFTLQLLAACVIGFLAGLIFGGAA